MKRYQPARKLLGLAAIALSLAACKPQPKAEAPEIRPVRTITVARTNDGETVLLTGHVQAEDETSFAFRIGGRMTDRPVNVGDHVEPGQILAKIDPLNEVNALRSAQANLAAARAQVVQTRAAFERQRILLGQGHTPRAQFDIAEKALRTAAAQVDSAEAQVEVANDRVGFTTLTADAAGTVTARGAAPGEVVQAGQMIVQIAHKGGRDAVFDVPAELLRSVPSNPIVQVSLAADPSVRAVGRVREVAPQADPVTRTFLVRVGLTDPPPAMLLGSTVNGRVQLEADSVISIPASALTETNRLPAVWVVDPKNLTVSMRNVELLRHDPGTAIIAHGLDTGDIVVTAGVHALHPGQKVRLLGPAG